MEDLGEPTAASEQQPFIRGVPKIVNTGKGTKLVQNSDFKKDPALWTARNERAGSLYASMEHPQRYSMNSQEEFLPTNLVSEDFGPITTMSPRSADSQEAPLVSAFADAQGSQPRDTDWHRNYKDSTGKKFLKRSVRAEGAAARAFSLSKPAAAPSDLIPRIFMESFEAHSTDASRKLASHLKKGVRDGKYNIV